MTQVTSFGTPAMVRATSGSVTGSVSGLPLHAGDLLVALVTAGGSTASAAAISTPSGWTQQYVISNVATTAYAWVAVYTKVAAGSDSAPAFTATLSGTVAMTCTVLELAAAANLNPVDTYGTYASGGTAGTLTLTATTSGNVSVAGEFAIACFCMERAAATNTWTPGSGWTNAANDGTTNTVLHTAVDYRANPSSGSTLAETGSWTTETTAYGAGIILTVAPQLGGIELYANDASTTISSGGTDAPASGTPEFLTAASWSSFPAASNTTTPPAKFHGADPASGMSGELIEVLNTTTGLAIRGAQGTTPVAHSGGFTLRQVIPAGNQQTRVYNVRDPQFGATGNGSTDDTAAIQAAVTACIGAGSGIVFFPPGTYKISSALAVNAGPVSITLQGSGPQASIIKQTSTTANGITISSSSGEVDNPQVFGLQILGPGSGSGTGVSVSAAAGASPVESLSMRDVLIESFGGWGFIGETIITSILDNVTCQSNRAGGFYLEAGGAGDGSSTTMTSCYALLNTGRGYYISGQVYSVLSGCAADSNYLGYEILNGTTISLVGCGCESTVAPGGSNSLDGTSFKINGPNSFSLISCRSLINPARAFWFTGGCYSGVVMACEEVSPAGTATASFQTDSGTTQTFIQCNGSTAQSLAGDDIWIGYNGDNILSIVNGGTDTSGSASASTPSISSTVAMQPSTSQDVMLYANVTTASTFALAIGPTSTPATTVVGSHTAAIGLIAVRVPKGWYVKSTFTSADVTWTAVTC